MNDFNFTRTWNDPTSDSTRKKLRGVRCQLTDWRIWQCCRTFSSEFVNSKVRNEINGEHLRKDRSLLVAFYDTQGLRWVNSTPEPTGGGKFASNMEQLTRDSLLEKGTKNSCRLKNSMIDLNNLNFAIEKGSLPCLNDLRFDEERMKKKFRVARG